MPGPALAFVLNPPGRTRRRKTKKKASGARKRKVTAKRKTVKKKTSKRSPAAKKKTTARPRRAAKRSTTAMRKSRTTKRRPRRNGPRATEYRRVVKKRGITKGARKWRNMKKAPYAKSMQKRSYPKYRRYVRNAPKRRTVRRTYRRNQRGMAGITKSVQDVFNMQLMTDSLWGVGGLWSALAIPNLVLPRMGIANVGFVGYLANFATAGLSGMAVGTLTRNKKAGQAVVFGGVVATLVRIGMDLLPQFTPVAITARTIPFGMAAYEDDLVGAVEEEASMGAWNTGLEAWPTGDESGPAYGYPGYVGDEPGGGMDAWNTGLEEAMSPWDMGEALTAYDSLGADMGYGAEEDADAILEVS